MGTRCTQVPMVGEPYRVLPPGEMFALNPWKMPVKGGVWSMTTSRSGDDLGF